MTASRASRLSLSSRASPVLGFGEQAAHLLVDDLLGALGVGSFLAEWGTAQVRGLVRSVADRSEAEGTDPIPSPS